MTLFEKIIHREVPAEIVYEDHFCIAIRDIDPKAPTHILIVPKQVLPRIAEATAKEHELLGHLLTTAAKIAQQEEISQSGYRLVINNGQNAGETIPHLHVHLLGGRPLAWPPG